MKKLNTDSIFKGCGGKEPFRIIVSALSVLAFALGTYAQSMIVESMTGALTQNEINAFKTFAQQKITAPSSWYDNVWVFGASGKAIEACGLMYEASKDTAILDRMIYLCDAALSDRNDLATAANGGQLKVWTGAIEPVWPVTVGPPASADVEQGQVLSHMAFCAKLIIETPSIWNAKVAIGDHKGYGATYKARALKYIKEADYVLDKWLLARFIKTSESNHYYFPDTPNTYKPLDPAPWNQAWMVTNSLVRLGLCHLMLQDDPARVAKYDAIALPNIKWFFANLRANKSAGSQCWIWDYALGSREEDSNHFAYDAEGMWIAYKSGRFGLKFSDLVPFANTYFDIILATTTNGNYAGYVDGTTGTSSNTDGDNYVRDEYIYLTEFRPDKFATVGTIENATDKFASNPQITGRFLWMKNVRNSFCITASSDSEGSIIPMGSVNVTNGASQSFLITPKAKYEIDSLVIDGIIQENNPTYTFTNVKKAHSISVKYRPVSSKATSNTAGPPVLNGMQMIQKPHAINFICETNGWERRNIALFTLDGRCIHPHAVSIQNDKTIVSFKNLLPAMYLYVAKYNGSIQYGRAMINN